MLEFSGLCSRPASSHADDQILISDHDVNDFRRLMPDIYFRTYLSIVCKTPQSGSAQFSPALESRCTVFLEMTFDWLRVPTYTMHWSSCSLSLVFSLV